MPSATVGDRNCRWTRLRVAPAHHQSTAVPAVDAARSPVHHPTYAHRGQIRFFSSPAQLERSVRKTRSDFARRAGLIWSSSPRVRRTRRGHADILDSCHSARFSEGRRRRPVDRRDGRVFLGPSTSVVAETAAPFFDSRGWRDGFVAGSGSEGKVLNGKDGRCDVLDATKSKFTLSSSRQTTGLCCHFARWRSTNLAPTDGARSST